MKVITYSFIRNKVEEDFDFSPIVETRKDYILAINDRRRRVQSLAVTDLLYKTFKEFFNKTDISFLTDADGKWQSVDGIYFSLSHSNDMVMCAISDNGKIGIDCEKVDSSIKRLSKVYGSDNIVELTKIWTQNEAKYKYGKNEYCSVESNIIKTDDCQYAYSVAYNGEKVDIIKCIM